MGEKLELKLKSPVGAEPAGYPWPLPVYVSVVACVSFVCVCVFVSRAPLAPIARSVGSLWPVW